MSRNVILCLVLAVVAVSASGVQKMNILQVSSPVHRLDVTDPGQDTLLFLEGFAVGIETDLGNLTICTKDVNITLMDFETGFALMKHAFSDVSVKDFELGLYDFGQGLQELSVAVRACGAETLAQEIESIASQLMSGTAGIVEMILKEALNIFYHRQPLTQEFKGAIAAFEAGDYYTSGVNVGKIVGVLLLE